VNNTTNKKQCKGKTARGKKDLKEIMPLKNPKCSLRGRSPYIL
jgi:hypothetical protein